MPATPKPLPATLPALAADLIPHRRPVRLIEQLVAVHTQGGATRTNVREESLLVTPEGMLERTAYLELMAQTYAAVKGWRDRQLDQPPRVGYLVGATGVECTGTARIGDPLTTTIQETGTFGAFKLVQGHIAVRDQRLAHGQFRLWLEPPHSISGRLDKPSIKKAIRPPIPLKQAIKAAAEDSLYWETDNSIVQSFCFPSDFIAFQGHFPDFPLLPAFAQVQIALVMLEAAWQAPLQLARIENAKFREPLRPGQTVTTRCHWETASSERQAAVTLTVSDRPASTFVLVARTAKSPPG
jgi:predicted hotdog family 3-hydroxylacyl-ACP dehydratase